MRRTDRTGLIILAAVCVGFFFGPTFVGWIRFYRFDEGAWASTNPENRYFMARYLVDHGTLNGLSREEVIGKLGKPDSDRAFDLQYKIGISPGPYNYEGGAFDIWLDEFGRVKRVKIYVP
jgi:hypothetical protein